ncbi:unnamed protein product, partial [Rotaria sordida]
GTFDQQIDLFNLIYIRRTAQIQYAKKKIEEKDLSWWDKLVNWWNSNPNQDNTGFIKQTPSETPPLSDKLNELL